jgi:hypothetical protein
LLFSLENCRHELASIFPGIFNGSIGVGGVKEFHVVELESWSGEIHIYKVIANLSGMCIFARCVCGGMINRFTNSPLYMQEGEYFSHGEFLVAGGTFDREGRFCCLYKKTLGLQVDFPTRN